MMGDRDTHIVDQLCLWWIIIFTMSNRRNDSNTYDDDDDNRELSSGGGAATLPMTQRDIMNQVERVQAYLLTLSEKLKACSSHLASSSSDDKQQQQQQMHDLQSSIIRENARVAALFEAMTRLPPPPPPTVAPLPPPPRCQKHDPPPPPTVAPLPPPPRCQKHDATSPSAAVPTVRVMTLNMLYEGHYRRYAQGQTLDESSRAELAFDFIVRHARQIEEDEGATGGRGLRETVDVFALQECSLKGSNLFKNGLGIAIARALPDYSLIYPPTGSEESVALLYNHRKLMSVGFPTYVPFAEVINPAALADGGQQLGFPIDFKIAQKGLLSQLFELRSSTSSSSSQQPIRFVVASAHVPFGSTPFGTASYLFDMHQQLSKPEFRKYILCGDFNASMSSKNELTVEAFKATFADGNGCWKEATRTLPWTARSPSERFEKIDYMFYTTNSAGEFRLVADERTLSIYPTDEMQLLPHHASAPPPLSNHSFFSDHAALAITFVLEPQPPQQIAAPLPMKMTRDLARCLDITTEMKAFRSTLSVSSSGALTVPRRQPAMTTQQNIVPPPHQQHQVIQRGSGGGYAQSPPQQSTYQRSLHPQQSLATPLSANRASTTFNSGGSSSTGSNGQTGAAGLSQQSRRTNSAHPAPHRY
ncbi:Hypothetical protein, putative [Bodo saltans]|uniref:Endonuclease/exonuclease/phosphatase domain-containing protein n=1 Tax=Bodo saltans TaxID=75058 RepID=A0A0S4JTA4_BODSA|nr:Hypothetical protein, putative [Bodo saltans]|eukprot:CUG93224.1 Hypothetical protein, putative [Bodo saltans]